MTLNLGFRYELEGGFRERFNRGLSQFDPNAQLPIADAAKAAYALNPVPELPVSQFDVRGGSLYLGQSGAPRTLSKSQPQIGERYISTGSLYLRAVGLLPLGLPPDDPFWSGAPADWTAKKIWSGQAINADHAI